MSGLQFLTPKAEGPGPYLTWLQAQYTKAIPVNELSFIQVGTSTFETLDLCCSFVLDFGVFMFVA